MADRNQPAGPPPYVYQAWPAMFYGPEGQQEIFQNEDEVPDNWVDHPSKIGKPGVEKTEFVAGNIGEDNDDVKALQEAYTQEGLVTILENAKQDNEDIEFLKSWPKLKLAQTIVHHDIVPEDLHEEE